MAAKGKNKRLMEALIEKEILVRVPERAIQLNSFQTIIPEQYEIDPDMKERIFAAANEFIQRNALSAAKIKLGSILSRIRQLPSALQKQELSEALKENISNQAETYGMDKAAVKGMILNSFTLEDYLLFSNGKSTMHNNEVVMGLLRDEIEVSLAKLLKGEYQKSVPAKKVKTKHSYIWQGKENELDELFKLVQKIGLIAPETNLKQFRAIFLGEPLDTLTPIKWHDDTASEVLYFILKLEESSNIKSGTRSDYDRLKACFVASNGTPFRVNFKNLKTNIIIELSKDKQRAIDKIVEDF